jgi:hypothetical protein
MSGETVVVQNGNQPPNEKNDPPATVVPTLLDQATEFGQMREAFRSTQAAVEQTRFEVEAARREREAMAARLEAMSADQARIADMLARQVEADEGDEETEADSTIIDPPIVETVIIQDQPPKKLQSRLNLFLFGREEE